MAGTSESVQVSAHFPLSFLWRVELIGGYSNLPLLPLCLNSANALNQLKLIASQSQAVSNPNGPKKVIGVKSALPDCCICKYHHPSHLIDSLTFLFLLQTSFAT